MNFTIQGLSPQPFMALYGLSDEALAARGAKRYVADTTPGYPDRIELRDVDPGEAVILVNHHHQPADSPYRASHAVFVREGADQAMMLENQIPRVLRVRPLSVRAFDARHWMLDAELCAGEDLGAVIEKLFSNEEAAYLQAHFAKRGCYAARIERR